MAQKNRNPEHSWCLTPFLGVGGIEDEMMMTGGPDISLLRKRWQTFQQHHLRMEGEICVEQPWNDAQIFHAAGEMSWQCSQGKVCYLIAGCAPLPHAWVGFCACKALWNPIRLHARSHDQWAPATRHPCVCKVESCFWRALARPEDCVASWTGWAVQ